MRKQFQDPHPIRRFCHVSVLANQYSRIFYCWNLHFHRFLGGFWGFFDCSPTFCDKLWPSSSGHQVRRFLWVSFGAKQHIYHVTQSHLGARKGGTSSDPLCKFCNQRAFFKNANLFTLRFLLTKRRVLCASSAWIGRKWGLMHNIWLSFCEKKFLNSWHTTF